MFSIIIHLAGEPQGKGRPRFVRKTGHAYTPAATRSYEAALRDEATRAMRGRFPAFGPLRVELRAYFGIPASWSNAKRQRAVAGELRPTKRPDMDNVAKMLDALNGIVWLDDAQVVDERISKFYDSRPRIEVEISNLGDLGEHDAEENDDTKVRQRQIREQNAEEKDANHGERRRQTISPNIR